MGMPAAGVSRETACAACPFTKNVARAEGRKEFALSVVAKTRRRAWRPATKGVRPSRLCVDWTKCTVGTLSLAVGGSTRTSGSPAADCKPVAHADSRQASPPGMAGGRGVTAREDPAAFLAAISPLAAAPAAITATGAERSPPVTRRGTRKSKGAPSTTVARIRASPAGSGPPIRSSFASRTKGAPGFPSSQSISSPAAPRKKPAGNDGSRFRERSRRRSAPKPSRAPAGADRSWLPPIHSD